MSDKQAGLDTKRLLDQQAPGLAEGFTVGQEAAYIASAWGMYSDMKGRASYLLEALPKEILSLLDRIEELEGEIEKAHKVLDQHISREGLNGNPYYLWGRVHAALDGD